MEVIPFDHLNSHFTAASYHKIFSASITCIARYKLSYYHYTASRNSRSCGRRDWGTARLYLQRGIAPLGTDASGIAMHRKQAPCHGKSGGVISRRSPPPPNLSLTLRQPPKSRHSDKRWRQYKPQISNTNFATSLSSSFCFFGLLLLHILLTKNYKINTFSHKIYNTVLQT